MYASNTGTTSVCLDCNDTLPTEERASHKCGPNPILLKAVIADDDTVKCETCGDRYLYWQQCRHDCDNCSNELFAGDMPHTLCNECRFISADKLEEWFSEALDEDGHVRIGTLTYSTSQVLKAVDPTAYRIALGEFADSLIEDGKIVEGYTD
jgi:hypothetical protein